LRLHHGFGLLRVGELAQAQACLERVALAGSSPEGRILELSDIHLDALQALRSRSIDQLRDGLKRYEEFLLPVYEECFSTLHQAGKIVGCHYDGRTASVKELIARAPIDLIESLTPPPEGDQTLAEARAVWPAKLFWSNINVSAYELPKKELQKLILERVEQAAPDGRRLAFEISEVLQDNWRESIPTVLEALQETRI
jgi:hypothetical protein